jgi:hypothetical protein
MQSAKADFVNSARGFILSAPAPQFLRRWLLPASLLLPVVAIGFFHYGNFRIFGPSNGTFLQLPFRFLANLGSFRLHLPEGLVLWIPIAIAGMLPTWLLGWGMLGRFVRDPAIRFLVAFPIGLGFTGVALEALAMAGWFNFPAILALSFITALLGFLLTRWGGTPPVEETVEIQPCGRHFRIAAWTVFSILMVFSFEHAVFFPPQYHDALLYYTYYPKLIFLNEGFPFPIDPDGFKELVQCQVGLGIGANYPHLFRLWQASICCLGREWSSIPGQFLPPLAALATALLLYRVVVRRWRSERLALWAILLLQSIPYWLWYQHWVSDYPLAVWLTLSAVALLASGNSGQSRVFAGLVGIAVAGTHLNYLMAGLWWFPLLLWLAMGKGRYRPAILAIGLLGVLLSSTWFIRNEVVTGNPVYPFFPELFGGENINPEVLKSCQYEWICNGDGLIQVGETFWKRVFGTPQYFLLNSRLSIKLGTLPFGWFFPGLLGLLFFRKFDLFRGSVAGFGAFLLFYEYAVSPFYLYHIMPVIPLMVLVACEWLSRLDRRRSVLGRLHTGLVLVVALTVGLPSQLYGAKSFSPTLYHTLHPGMAPDEFLDMSFPGEYRMWKILNARLPQGAVLLTHENRYYYLRDDIKVLHLDDYRLVELYGKPPGEVEARLRELGVGYYLKIPNERNHPVVRFLGVDALLGPVFHRLAVIPSGSGDLALYGMPKSNGDGQ